MSMWLSKLKRVFSNMLYIDEIIDDIVSYKLRFLKLDVFANINKLGGVNLHPFVDSQGYTHTVTVSLTSYGDRVYSVCYVIYSILMQSVQPNRIILWLSEQEYNDENLPQSLKDLRSRGVEIAYCPDYRSYKKIIPTLRKYSEDVIITIDDDVLYGHETLEYLINAYLQEPEYIWFMSGSKMAFDKNGNIKPYVTWYDEHLTALECNIKNFPTGIGGILYPPHSLAEEVTDETLFMKLAPTADDIWLKAMSLKQGKNCRQIKLNKPVMRFHTGIKEVQTSALCKDNIEKNLNDKAVHAVFDYFDLWKLFN